jgi:subtilisin family serine protease
LEELNMLKEYIVSLNKDIDYDSFWNEIETNGSGSTYVPTRSVDIINERPSSLRACHYALTDEEAEKLRNDPRVYAVEIPPSQRDDVTITPFTSQTGIYSKIAGTPNSNWINWGLFRQASRINNTNNITGTLTYDYSVDGTGVDFVIQDSGLQCDHPDFEDADGVTRVQKINWWTAAGNSGPPPWTPNGEMGMPAGFYTDTYGHGTHCAGIAVGKTYGRAKNSKIYVMKVNGLGGTGGISDIYVFDLITGWHNNKPVDPVTGYKRPTVVNMSWGYVSSFTSIAGGNYRGTSWVGFLKQPQYGMIGSNNRYGTPISVIEVDVQECLAAGVVLVGAAGNYFQTGDTPTGPDYNNYFIRSGSSTRYYYMRGSTPTAVPNVICVGAVDVNYSSGLERKVGFSDSGPRVDVYSPGVEIVSTISTVYNSGFAQYPSGVNNYPNNPSFKIANVSGTSMAAPNVAGIAAQLLQVYPGETPAQIRQRVIDLATPNMLFSTGSSTDYAVANSLHGSPNRYAYYQVTSPPPPPPPPPTPPGENNLIANGAIRLDNVTITT